MSLRLGKGVLQGAPIPVEGQAGPDAPWSWWYCPLSSRCWHRAPLSLFCLLLSGCSAASSLLAALEEGNPCCTHRAPGRCEPGHQHTWAGSSSQQGQRKSRGKVKGSRVALAIFSRAWLQWAEQEGWPRGW